MYTSTPNNRLRRESKPSPPERDLEYLKKPNMSSSPSHNTYIRQ